MRRAQTSGLTYVGKLGTLHCLLLLLTFSVQVVPTKGAYVVNLGDMFMRWYVSGGLLFTPVADAFGNSGRTTNTSPILTESSTGRGRRDTRSRSSTAVIQTTLLTACPAAARRASGPNTLLSLLKGRWAEATRRAMEQQKLSRRQPPVRSRLCQRLWQREAIRNKAVIEEQ